MFADAIKGDRVAAREGVKVVVVVVGFHKKVASPPSRPLGGYDGMDA